jgi:uncharacterized protein involved in exopolysaccharide biosynthesis
MADREHNDKPEGLKLGDIYFVLFRQKWLILFFCVVGVGAGLWMLEANPPTYRSQAELFIRYVVQGKSLSLPGNEQNTRPLSDLEQSIINTEVQILKSFDLAHQVAEAVGAERILAAVDGGGTNLDRAAHVVMSNLTIDATKGSVIPLTFEHPDKEIAQEVLNKVIHIYYTKHAEAHQSVGFFGDFLQEETKRLQDQLADTERQLRGAKRQAGIDSPGLTSLIDAKKAYGDQLSKIRMDLFNAAAELAGHQAVLDQERPAIGAGCHSRVQKRLRPARRVHKERAGTSILLQRQQRPGEGGSAIDCRKRRAQEEDGAGLPSVDHTGNCPGRVAGSAGGQFRGPGCRSGTGKGFEIEDRCSEIPIT